MTEQQMRDILGKDFSQGSEGFRDELLGCCLAIGARSDARGVSPLASGEELGGEELADEELGLLSAAGSQLASCEGHGPVAGGRLARGGRGNV